jgi:ATP-binding cassette, subfamily F, member 3
VTLLNASQLTKYYGSRDLFRDVTAGVNREERIALVGANGVGKTTMLRILAGIDKPEEGSVHYAHGLRLSYMPQDAQLSSLQGDVWSLALGAFDALLAQGEALRRMELDMAEVSEPVHHQQMLEEYGHAQAAFELAGGYDYELRLSQVLQGLGFAEKDWHTPLHQLSGGQQTRLLLARQLLEEPDVLLLDEPINHLDLAAIEWLEEWLQKWRGALIIVAHDRYFMDKVANRVWELAQQRLEVFRGNFSQYMLQRAERNAARQAEFERQRQFIEKEEDFIRRNIAGQRSREAKGRRKRLERLQTIEPPVGNKTLKLNLGAPLRSGDHVLATYNLVVGYPDGEPLISVPDLEIMRGQRVALLGPNGAGKTTFLKTILGELKPLHGHVRHGAAVKIGYMAQTHARLTPENSILDEIMDFDEFINGGIGRLNVAAARDFLARFLFSGDDVFKPISALSGGERSRVALARLSLEGANFLVLDEPTNHLDIPAQETLEEVLKNFAGTILLVSHDRCFVDVLATHIWALIDKTVLCQKGGYSAYLAARQMRPAEEAEAVAGQVNERLQQRQLEKDKKRTESRLQRQMADLEIRINRLEGMLKQLESDMQQASEKQDYLRLRDMGAEYQRHQSDLVALMEEWASLEAA